MGRDYSALPPARNPMTDGSEAAWRKVVKLKIGDQVRVLHNTARNGQIGTIIDLVPHITNDDRFQSYVVRFDTPKGAVSEYYLRHELYIPFSVKQCSR